MSFGSRRGAIAAALLLSVSVAPAQTVTTATKIASDFSSFAPPDSMMTQTGEGGAPRSLSSSSGVTAVFQYDTANRTAVDAFVASTGVTIRRDNKQVGVMTITLPNSRLSDLAALSSVSFISPDRAIRRNLDFAVPATYGDIAFRNNITGSNIGIAIIDSGVNAHGDLANRIVYSENFVPGETTTADTYGHGTHVAVIAAGNAAQSSGSASFFKTFRGLAPGARIINLRVLDANGAGTDSSVIAAIDRAIELRTRHNIRVINLSLGRRVMESYRLDPLCRAVKRAWDAGIVVVVAAGNRGRDYTAGTKGYGTIGSPGNSPYVITVGAMRDMSTNTRVDDLLATYSSKGPTVRDFVVKPDLVAPGNQIVAGLASDTSTLPAKMPNSVLNKSYYQTGGGSSKSPYLLLSGTSMATPVVSGTVALMLQRDSSLTPDTVKARLMITATHNGFPPSYTYTDKGNTYEVQHDIFSIGAGYLDVWAALNSTVKVSSSRRAVSPRAFFDSATGKVKIQTTGVLWGDSAVWGSSSAWATNVVWGDTLLWGDNVVWGDSAPWGASGTNGFTILWGDNILWGDSVVFPESISSAGDRN